MSTGPPGRGWSNHSCPLPPDLRTFPTLAAYPQPSHIQAFHACPPIRPSVCLLLTAVSTLWASQGTSVAGTLAPASQARAGPVALCSQPPVPGPAQPRGSWQPSLCLCGHCWAGQPARPEGKPSLVSEHSARLRWRGGLGLQGRACRGGRGLPPALGSHPTAQRPRGPSF